MTLTRGQVHELLAGAGIRPSRALGQNFVADPNTVRRIARLAGVGPGDAVVEVGAGLGSLTVALAETGAHVVAVELDRRLLPLLRDRLVATGVAGLVEGEVGRVAGVAGAAGLVEVVAGDAMALDWAGLLSGLHWTLVANLPYNIATPLVADLLDRVPAITRMVVMVQREVAERLVAGPGDAAYGAVSVKVAYWATARLLGAVPSTVFVPRPSVESALVGIHRLPEPA
ncbi:MAG: 16S rRNA (adenine(1518)-N(6)/adenine(1519)-N(6))-dimethyltransferase RsmA, partial [Actinomycetota bacterium]|nr:16S rRNA (adenine(1518)-N(6)/adenine(1519)-N(6))-dimethyltransferase RsmA [Actinomycetota bacterium]